MVKNPAAASGSDSWCIIMVVHFDPGWFSFHREK
jgi:hypothetical protein